MKLPIILAKDLKKGIIGMRNIKLGGFDVAIGILEKIKRDWR